MTTTDNDKIVPEASEATPGIQAFTAKDCINYPPVSYIVEDLIEAGTITMVSGKEKIGKTYVLMNLALCMAAGLPWLGMQTMQDAKGNILWINLDMPRNTTMRRINQISNGIEESWEIRKPDLFKNFGMMDGQLFRDYGYKNRIQFYSASDAVDCLREYMIENNVKVCFIDNLVQIEGSAEENKANDIQAVFSGLKQLRDETDCAFIVIHHTTKNGDRGRGSSAIFGETDLNLQLDPCTEPNENALLLRMEGARNTASHEIGMTKHFEPRMGEDGTTHLLDDNGHTIFNFKLTPTDPKKLNTGRNLTGWTNKSAETMDKNITALTDLFTKNGNTPMSQTSLVSGSVMTGTNNTRKNAIWEAVRRDILLYKDRKFSLKVDPE